MPESGAIGGLFNRFTSLAAAVPSRIGVSNMLDIEFIAVAVRPAASYSLHPQKGAFAT